MIKMYLEKRKGVVVGILALLLTMMHILGWQISMDYGSSVHQSSFFQSIGVLSIPQCLIWGILEWLLLFGLLYALFFKVDKWKEGHFHPVKGKYLWLICWGALFIIWLIFLWGCYPGFYNYDVGNQLPQVLYEEVPYNAHHPLLHTLLGGGLIKLGYFLRDVDLSFGVFLYNFVQMFICSGCLGYSLGYIWKKSGNKILLCLSFVFYAICPPIVMFAMSTTKDIWCYSFLIIGLINMLELYDELESGKKEGPFRWILIGICFAVSALLRKNIIYAIVVFAFFSVLILRKECKKQILLFVSVVAVYFVVNNGLEYALNAIPGSVNEALCVPYQQIARLYNEVGAEAFTQEEYELLGTLLPPDALSYYDPVMGDHTKANFNVGLETLKANVWPYFQLWLKKGVEYPLIYLESVLYNTYQAWYPGTQIYELRGVRYFDITGWQYEYSAPHWQGLFDFYESVRFGEYIKWPVLRLFFVTGTMFWGAVITWFYGIWKRDKSVILSYLLVLLICGTTFLGPVSDVRYYLQLFYLFPVGISIIFFKNKGIAEDEISKTN